MQNLTFQGLEHSNLHASVHCIRLHGNCRGAMIRSSSSKNIRTDYIFVNLRTGPTTKGSRAIGGSGMTRLVVSAFFGICATALGLTSTAAWAEKKVALVVGNSSYEFVSKLPNPANDATAVAK